MRVEIETLGGDLRGDGRPAAHIGQQDGGQTDHADDENEELHRVRQGHCPHAAGIGVDQHDGGADADAENRIEAGERLQDAAEGHHQRRHPADVGGDRTQAGEHAGAAVEAFGEEGGHGHHAHLSQDPHIEGAGEKQAQSGTEGVGDDGAKATLVGGAGGADAQASAEPGRRQRCGGQRQ